MTLRDQILARIDATPFRPPTANNILRAVNAMGGPIEAVARTEIDMLLFHGLIDTETGTDGLTYRRAKPPYVVPTVREPSKSVLPDTSGLGFFPSRNQKPVDIGKSAFCKSRQALAMRAADRAPHPTKQQKSEEARDHLAAMRKAARAAKSADKKARRVAVSADRKTRQQKNRAVITKHLTEPMTTRQFAELSGLEIKRAHDVLTCARDSKYLCTDGDTFPVIYFFEHHRDQVESIRATAKKVIYDRQNDHLGIVPADVAAAHAAGATIFELAQRHHCGVVRMRAAIKLGGGKVKKGGTKKGARRTFSESHCKALSAAGIARNRRKRVDAFAGAAL